ncbi:MAG: PKD domain-containing protein, partial [Mariniphaga sp.]|nr:PKD domain-containing protein [Mariniphaga sp.]
MNTILSCRIARKCLYFAFFLFTTLISLGTNPPITNNLTNLSEGIAQAANDDRVPEMVIEGNIIHTVWNVYVSGSEAYLYYRRSTDLGETWESPQLIYQFKDAAKATDYTSQRLAVSGNNVYIGFVDYDYNDNGTGKLYLSTSTNSGASFGAVVELTNSGGGYNSLDHSFIKAEGNNVAIAFDGSGAKEGVRLLFSSNNGTSFNETTITEDNNAMSDFWYDGNQLIVVHEYAYYFYGLNTGRVYISVSNDNGASFITSKVSLTYKEENGNERERSRCYHDVRYVPKVAKDGNNIHLIFTGYNENGIWTILYTRSTDNGNSFEKTVDINNGKVGDTGLQAGQESLVAKNGHVYMEYLSTGSKVYLVRSEDNGSTLTEPQDLMTESTHYIQTTWWPQLVVDPSDETGKTIYFGCGAMMTRKSTNGGESFHNTTYLFPLFDADVRESVLRIDNSGNIHWLARGRMKHYPNYDYDMFYGEKKIQPEPGEENKAYHLVTTWNDIQETTIVPSSPSIEFDSIMTGEAWVKILDVTNKKINIFGKVNAYDGDTYQPSGYQMTFHESGGKRYLNAGLQTDKGQFINWTGGTINDTLWHHIAFTYDANAGLNNFKTYFDGLLVLEQTVTGVIIPGDGMLMIGSRRNFNTDANYLIDDVRLWNRALTQEELIENQTKSFTGQEDSLKLWLNFDDTFKDISGNGNDAIPLYLGELKTSNFDPPLTDFEMYQVANEISFNNKTSNATSWLWDFGDENTSEQGNPKYTYSTAGEYQISLLAKNANSITSAIGHSTIVGLDRIEPTKAGNLGYATISVFGGGLTIENTVLILRKEGETDIIGENLSSPGEGSLAAFFDLYGKTLGEWDMIVSKNNTEMILEDAFNIIQGVEAAPWLNISGRGAILFNRWQTYTINYGNNGNVDAYSVPIWLALTNHPDLEIEFVDFDVVVPEVAIQLGVAEDIKKLDLFFETDVVLGEPMNAIVYPLVIPVIPANSSSSVHIRIKTPDNFKIKAWMNPPWVEYNPDESSTKSIQLTKGQIKLKVAECITGVLDEGIVDIGTSAIPGVGCAWSIGKQVYQTAQTPPWSEKGSFWGTLWNTAVTVVDCGVNLSGVGGIVKGVGVFMANMGGYVKSMHECNQIGKDLSTQSKDIDAVSSFDPNEMIGPAGYGDQNYIVKNSLIPYTILFENKSEATAPAHDVFIIDTLDLSTFDVSNFGFSSFGWGDTILSPPGNKLKEFSMDVDLRPEINLITRVSARLDTITGIIKWEFLSLNPETMNLEEDPYIGFLPPNTTSPEGEGFVSFSIGLRDELTTNSEIRNKATIIFDANQPILTNEYINTLDLDAPESQVYPLDENIKSNFNVAWIGSDQGSGIGGYTIYVLENDTALYPWLENTDEVTAVFHGELGSNYKFYSIAIDNVGHVEADPGQN